MLYIEKTNFKNIQKKEKIQNVIKGIKLKLEIKNYISIILIFLFIVFIFFFNFNSLYAANISNGALFTQEEYQDLLEKNNLGNIPTKDLEIDKKYIFLTYSEKLDKNIYEFNNNIKFNPASITKVVTSILAIENLNLNSNLLIKTEDTILPNNYVALPIVPGESITISNLLKYTLIPSCNDAAKALERAISEKGIPYKDKANELFEKLEMNNTHFTSSYGYEDKDHYTTANDLLKLAKYVMKNDTFKEIIKNNSVEVPAYGIRPYSIKKSTNLFLENSPYYREDVIGLKTGVNPIGGYCFISVKKDPENNLTINILAKLNTENERYIISNILFDNSDKYINAYESNIKRIEFERKQEELRIQKEKEENLKRLKEKIKNYTIIFISLAFILIIFKKKNNRNENENKNKNENKNENKKMK